MNADEFYAMRAKKQAPHSDEICWDAHDRIPDHTTASSQPSRWMWLAAFVAVKVMLGVIYLWEVVK